MLPNQFVIFLLWKKRVWGRVGDVTEQGVRISALAFRWTRAEPRPLGLAASSPQAHPELQLPLISLERERALLGALGKTSIPMVSAMVPGGWHRPPSMCFLLEAAAGASWTLGHPRFFSCRDKVPGALFLGSWCLSVTRATCSAPICLGGECIIQFDSQWQWLGRGQKEIWFHGRLCLTEA